MTETALIALLGYLVTLLVAIGGWVFAYHIHRDAKRLDQLERKTTRLKEEVRARIALEKTACHWLGDLTARTPRSVQLELRTRNQERSGLRPKLSENDLA
jgi:hypothetical protein